MLQQELAENVAKEVHSAALPPKPSGRRIAPEAHDAYLRGRYNWFTGSSETVRESFEKAIQLQPDYAAAYSGLSDYYTAGAVEGILVPKEALPKGEVLAQKALQLDDSVAEAHNSMGPRISFTGGTGRRRRRNREGPLNSIQTLRKPIIFMLTYCWR